MLPGIDKHLAFAYYPTHHASSTLIFPLVVDRDAGSGRALDVSGRHCSALCFYGVCVVSVLSRILLNSNATVTFGT